ncbi:MAG: hypothetical protein IPH55_01380 [Betaproteobacteria bacterium]|nr:hypothetical protein [Betaproteobacteria bacterium]
MQALPVVAQCHLDGVPFDWQQHAILCARWQHDLTSAEQVLQQLGIVNPRSTQQIGSLLQQSLDAATLAAWPRTRTGKLQLDHAALTRHGGHPVLGPLARHRTMQKLVSTYGKGYLKHRHPVTQRAHPHYRILGAATGRFQCSNPNIQQLPRSAEIRGLIRAEPGRLLVCADYSQIELRIAAAEQRSAAARRVRRRCGSARPDCQSAVWRCRPAAAGQVCQFRPPVRQRGRRPAGIRQEQLWPRDDAG